MEYFVRYKQDGEKIRYWDGIDGQSEIEAEYPLFEDPTAEKPALKSDVKQSVKRGVKR